MYGRTMNHRFVRVMRTSPTHQEPGAGTAGGGGVGQGQQQGGGQQGAGGGGPPQQQDGQQGQQQSGQGQQGGDPFGGLLDQARQQQGQQGGGQQPGQGGGQQQGQPVLTAEAVAQIVESVVDRRINAANNPGGGRGRHQQGGNQNQNQQQEQVPQVDQGARREARLAYREYVGDQIAFLNDTERAAAVQIGTAMIATWDGDGDADAFGKNVANSVASTMRELGEMYKRVTIEALKKQGLLKDQPQGPGAGSGSAAYSIPAGGSGFVLPGTTGGAQKNPQAAISAAAAAAAKYNEAAGWQPAGQQQAS